MAFLSAGNVYKKMMCALFAGAMLGGSCLAAENAKVKELVGSQYYDLLVKKGVISEYRDDGSMGLKMLPKTEFSSKISGSMIKKEPKNYPYTYEGLYLLNKKQLLANGSSGKTDITIDDVSKVIRSISKMQGMKYYSTTKKERMRSV